MEQITVKDFAAKIADKRDFYEAVLKNGNYLPSIKASMTTEAYLIGVMEGAVWCPRYDAIRLLPCTRPPAK